MVVVLDAGADSALLHRVAQAGGLLGGASGSHGVLHRCEASMVAARVRPRGRCGVITIAATLFAALMFPRFSSTIADRDAPATDRGVAGGSLSER